MVGDFFFPGDKSYNAEEIPCKEEIKNRLAVAVKMPEVNENFNSLALKICKDLPILPEAGSTKEDLRRWQPKLRTILRNLVQAKEYPVKGVKAGEDKEGNLHITRWKLELGRDWEVPAVEMSNGQAKGTVLLLHDSGRAACDALAKELLAQGKRVLVIDPFYFGESRMPSHDYLFALLMATVGERPLGIQASQVAAIARWAKNQFPDSPVSLQSQGPRSSLFALIAAGLETEAIAEVKLSGSLGSLKEIIEQNRAVTEMPEMFCFGLLRDFDIFQLTLLVAPRPLYFLNPSDRARKELQALHDRYRLLGKEFDPLR